MGRPSETNEAIMLDQYIEALLDNSDVPPPANLEPELAQLARTIMLSLNQSIEYPVLLDIWQDSLAQAQYLATKAVAHSGKNGKAPSKAEPTLTTYRVAPRPQRWSASVLMGTAGIAAIFLLVVLIGATQFLQTDDDPTTIQSARKLPTGTPTSFATITSQPTALVTEEALTVVLPDELTCMVGETVKFELTNDGQAVSVVSSDIFRASVESITTIKDDNVEVEVLCLDEGDIELVVTIVQDLESFSSTIDLHIVEADPDNPVVVTPANTLTGPQITPFPTATTVFIPTNTPGGDIYPAPIINTNLPTSVICGVGGEIALEYTYTSTTGVYTASRMIPSNNNVRDRVVTTDDGLGILVMACDNPGTTTATLYVFYPEFGIPPEPSIATTHTMTITVTQETATPITPDPNYPVPIYTDVPTALTCNQGDSQQVDIGFSTNPEAAPGALWLNVSSANATVANAHSSSSNQVDTGFFWFDCYQAGSTTITLQLARLADSGDPGKAAYHDIAVTVNSAATSTPDPNYPIPSFGSVPGITNCAPGNVIQIPFSYSPNPSNGGPVTAFAGASSANQNILIQNLEQGTNSSTVYLQCNTAGMGKVTLYIYKEGDISFSDMQAGNWSKANQHQFNVNVLAPTPSPNVSPTPTATFTPTPTPTFTKTPTLTATQ